MIFRKKGNFNRPTAYFSKKDVSQEFGMDYLLFSGE